MVKIDRFTIVLENSENVYYPGDKLVGFVFFKVSERFKINGVRLNVNGSARIIWTEGNGQYRQTFKANEHYLNQNIVFMEKKENIELFLEQGEKSLPFELVLPDNLPTSFEHEYGRIRYTLNATIDIPWGIDKHVTKTFSVINHLDLNNFPTLNQAFEIKDSKTVCCGPWKSQPINAEFSVKKTAYVPGETIFCHVTLNNRSSNQIKVMTVSLIEQVFLHPEGGENLTKRVDREVISVRYTHHVDQNSNTEWSDIKIEIPPVCASTNCRQTIINISYALMLYFEASGINASKSLTIPIVIGTKPYQIKNETPNRKAKLTYKHSLFSVFPRVPYQVETIRGHVIESDANTFAPQYPYFRHGSF